MGESEKTLLYRDRSYRDKIRAIQALKLAIGCEDCGYRDHAEALDFDHVYGEKKFGITTGWKRKWSDLEEEILKCQIRCANCHRVATAKRRK